MKSDWRWLILGLWSSVAIAAPPPDANPSYHEWFEHQYSVMGVNCCNVSDGHILDDSEWRATSKGYEVLIEGRWFLIFHHSYRDTERGGPNPTGHAVVWYLGKGDNVHIYCFSPGFEG